MGERPYDVIILGAGITGCTLGLILAGQGLRTVILDHSPHPRFALGESLLKPTVLWMRLLAMRFNVEELAVVANLNRIHDRIAPTSGIKKSFGFVRHTPGNPHTVAQWWANIPLNYAEDVLEAHLFRQDIDAWLYARAALAGCELLTGKVIADESGATGSLRLRTSCGTLEGAFLVDCTTQASTLTRTAGLRETPTRLRSNSRTLYTHLTGVRPFDHCAAAPTPALPWHEGTLHHLLDGAWMWVIPFDNHPRSTNPLVSVGVSFDNSLHPLDTSVSPAQEWQALLARYPALAAQFGGARAVRPWVSTGRLQVSARRITGERFCLLGNAAGSVDALYSRGLLNTMQSLHLLAELLLEAVRDQDFSPARFAPVETLQTKLLAVHDALVHGSYVGFRTPRLTDWWLAAWSLTERLSLPNVMRPLGALERGDRAEFDAALAVLKQGDAVAGQEVLLPVLNAASAVMEDFATGCLDEQACLQQLGAVAAPLAAFGHDLDQFRQLTTVFGFSRSARRLLDIEQKLTAAIETVDRFGNLPVSLRRSTLVNGLVRLLAVRNARDDDVLLEAPALAEALHDAIVRVAAPGHEPSRYQSLCAGLLRLRLQRAPPRVPRLAHAAGFRVLLECHANARYVGVRYTDADNGGLATLELETEGDDERLIVSLTGRLTAPEVCAALA